MNIAHEKLTVRPLEPSDADILYRWLNDARVLTYYEGRDKRHTMRMVEEHFLYEHTENSMERGLVAWDNVSVGYIQTYRIGDEEMSLYGYRAPLRVYGMDQFLGEPELWNKGIGSLLVKVVANWLVTSCEADYVVMDPRTENKRAIHVYEKCGFRKKKLLPKRELHEGRYCDCWLMELSRNP